MRNRKYGAYQRKLGRLALIAGEEFSACNAICEVLDPEAASNGLFFYYKQEIWFDGDTIEIFVFRKLVTEQPCQSINPEVRIIENSSHQS